MPLRLIGDVWKLARRVEDLFELQTKARESFEIVADRLKALEDRMTKLEATFEAEKYQLVTEAKAASTAAATMVAGGVLSDAVTRITRSESRTGRSGTSS